MGSGKVSDTACRVTRRRGFASSLPRANSVNIVPSAIIKNKETTRLEMVSNVRRLLRRIFFKISLLNFIAAPDCQSLNYQPQKVYLTHTQFAAIKFKRTSEAPPQTDES